MNKPVFCIGLPKTGTTSLCEALNSMGYHALHNPEQFWNMLHVGIYRYDSEPWDALCHFGFRQYRCLSNEYPDAYFILTIRDKHSWLDSCQRQFTQVNIHGITQELVRMECFGTLVYDRGMFEDVYDAHNRNVLQFFSEIAADHWLLMDVADGWGELPEFLHCETPAMDFPHDHKSDQAIVCEFSNNDKILVKRTVLWKA